MSVEELRRYDLVLPTVTQRVGQEIEHLLSLLGLVPTSSLRSSSYGFIREMLLATDLISVMPRLMMAGDLLRGALRVVPLPIPAPDRPAGLILPRDRALPQAGRAFVECLRAHVAEVVERGLAPITGGDNDGGKSDTTGPGNRRRSRVRTGRADSPRHRWSGNRVHRSMAQHREVLILQSYA